MPDIPQHEAEPLRIVKSLQKRYENAGETQHLRPVYLMALGMAAVKILELEKLQRSVDAIDLRLDEETEELLIKQAHKVIAATARPFPWWRNITSSAVGGFGTLLLAGGLYAFLRYIDSIGLLPRLW